MRKETFIEILSSVKIFKKIIDFIKNKRIIVKACSLCLVGIIAVFVTIISSGLTFGFNVRYSGSNIATVKNEAVFNDAKNIALSTISSSNAGKAIKNPAFALTLTVANRLNNAYQLATKIIENTNDIVESSSVTVNGNVLVCCQSDKIESYLDYCRTRFDVDGATNTSQFVDDVKITKGYYLKSEICDIEHVEQQLLDLPIKTIAVTSSYSDIAFTSSVVKTNEQLKGYEEITTVGENGLDCKTESIELLNGKEVTRSEISDQVIKEPVNQVTTIGTANPNITSFARSAGFICPINSGSYQVSAWFGDGRGHKGIDLAAKSGTSIFAASSGTVVFSGYDGAYGNSVVIDHGNGYSTRYAHASSLNVSKGQTVSQGDLIALVGCTGASTGSHLHFEILVNKKQVNPAEFLSFR